MGIGYGREYQEVVWMVISDGFLSFLFSFSFSWVVVVSAVSP